MSRLVGSRLVWTPLATALVGLSIGVLAPEGFGRMRSLAAQAEPFASNQTEDIGQCSGGSARQFARSELFFGTSKRDGGTVSDDEFRRFLDAEITPRFPEGLTLLAGTGQFRGSNGQIIREGSKLLILLYPWEDSKEDSQKIEEIRSAYERDFEQEAVLRADDRFPSCVSF